MRSYVSCIFADPYDGPTNPSSVIKVTKALLDAGCYEVSLGDTLGVGTPCDVESLLREMLKTIPAERLAGHFHDTYGQAVANVVKSYELGLRTFDSSVAGLGGCPFANGAKGNLSTEDLVYTLHQMGIQTGVNLDEISTIGAWISQELKIPNGSRAGAAIIAKQTSASAISTSSSATSIAPARSWAVFERTDEYCVYRRGANIKINLTRPRNGNALTNGMIQALIQLFHQFSVDDSVSRIIISSEGKFFCTGMDLKGTTTSEQMFSALTDLFHVIDSSPKTTIAAINGPCLGGGVGLAFVCDIRLATTNATFKLSEVRLGLCPAIISKYIIREWGFGFARASILTAQEVLPSELERLGAIYNVVPDREMLEVEMEKLLDRLRFSAPRASSLSKDLLRPAWTDAGGEEQARVIENSFTAMMAEGSESKFALQQFREGIKEVDWDALSQKAPQSKL
jgi:hydroxymethylglutaryl-CoA lyase